MLNDEIKTKALAEYEKAVKDYTSIFETLKAEYERLNLTRKQASDLIARVEKFINCLANTPKEFTTTVGYINIERANFPKTEDLASKAQKAVFESAYKIMAGIAAGAAFAQLAPKVAVLVATTFGKASTGIPITALSGAAKNNAALAWLGRGAKAIGGGGIKAGKVLLTSAWPVGIGIAVGAVAGSLITLASDNKRIADQAMIDTEKLRIAEAKLIEKRAVISQIHAETEALFGCVSEQFKRLELLKDCSYAELSNDEQLQLGSLVNNTLALAEMVNKVVDESAEAEE